MSTVKVRKKRGGSAHEPKKLDDGATDTTRKASDLNALHPQWEKVINDEIRDNLCLQIREEVFEILFQICYEKYLEKQVIDFTVHCVHQAFLKVASVYFIKLDPGEKPIADNPSWTPDKEPVPSRMDPWLSFTVPVVERKPEPEPETPSTPEPSLVTEASSVSTSARKLDEEELSGLALQVYARYQPSTEWPPAAVESVLRHSAMPAKPKPPPEEPPKEQPKRPSGSSRKSKQPTPSSKPTEISETRPVRLPPIKSKSDVKKAASGAASPSTMEIPRPPVIPISALPPSRAEVKCTVVPLKDTMASTISVKKQPSGRKKPASVRWSKSTKEITKEAN